MRIPFILESAPFNLKGEAVARATSSDLRHAAARRHAELAQGHALPHRMLVVAAGVDEGLFSIDFPRRRAPRPTRRAGRPTRRAPGKRDLADVRSSHPLPAVPIDSDCRAAADGTPRRRPAAVGAFVLLRGGQEPPAPDASAQHHRPRPFRPHLAHEPFTAPMPLRVGLRRGQVLLEAQARAGLQAFLPPRLDAVRGLPRAHAALVDRRRSGGFALTPEPADGRRAMQHNPQFHDSRQEKSHAQTGFVV